MFHSRFSAVTASILAVTAFFSLSGCVSSGAPSHPVVPTSTALPVPSDVEKAFRQYADASCALAGKEGVVETTGGDQPSTLILVPRSRAYHDFTAVWTNPKGTANLIWTTESFMVCNLSVGYAMSNGARPYVNMAFDFLGDQNSIRVTIDQGKRMGVTVERYVITDGFFSEVHNESDGGDVVTTIDYRGPTEAEIALLHRGVDEFLAANPDYGVTP